jgi:hypothetical protein
MSFQEKLVRWVILFPDLRGDGCRVKSVRQALGQECFHACCCVTVSLQDRAGVRWIECKFTLSLKTVDITIRTEQTVKGGGGSWASAQEQ